MKKTLAIIFPALFLALLFTANQAFAASTSTLSIEDNVAGVVLSSSTSPVEPPIVVSSSSIPALPDFEITEVIVKTSTDDATKNYYATVVNRGGDYLLNDEKSLGLSFFVNEAAYYSVGTSGETFAKDQKISVGPLLAAKDGVYQVRANVNPLFSVSEKKYDNNFFQKEIKVEAVANVPAASTSTPPKATSTAPAIKKETSASVFNLKKEASLIAPSGSASAKLELLTKALKTVRSSQKMAENMTKFTETIKKQFPKESITKIYTINNFVTYGTASTEKLTPKARFDLVSAFVKTNKKLPNTEADWTKVLEGKK